MERGRSCDYCGLRFSGAGYSPDGDSRFCCYGCYLVQRILGARGEEGIASSIILRLGIGAFLSMNVMCISLVMYLDTAGELGESIEWLRWILLVLSTPAMLLLGWPFLLSAIRGLQARRLSTDVLIMTGSLTAYVASAAHVIRGSGHVYFDTATMILVIVTVGRLLEASAKNRTSGAIRDMLRMLPDTARVLRDGVEHEIPSDQVTRGDHIVVRPGERIAADGRILSGECMVEEAAFTGESRPRPCGAGDRVFGGSVNCDGLITVEATAVGPGSVLSQMQRIVERAREERAPAERLAERISSVFVPAVWTVALGAAAYWGLVRGDVERAGMSALAVLVVACPCALGLATPLVTCLAIGRAAGSGVLVRSGGAMEALSRIRAIFFDKTGTLTDGNLAISRIDASGSGDELLAWAASLECASEHSIARAIVSEAQRRGLPLGTADDIRVRPGQGLEGTITLNGSTARVLAGSARLIPELDPPSAAAATMVFVSVDGRTLGAILLSDSVRPVAAEAVQRLRNLGVRCAIVSGDRAGPVQVVADQTGIETVLSECSPEDKVIAIRKARSSGDEVAMVGDGINDAPALAEADLGIAVGGGTDLAREASDVTLLGNDLLRIPWAIELSRRSCAIIRGNLTWAFGYNSVAMTLAFLGYVHPLIAATAMLASSLTIIANSMKVLK